MNLKDVMNMHISCASPRVDSGQCSLCWGKDGFVLVWSHDQEVAICEKCMRAALALIEEEKNEPERTS